MSIMPYDSVESSNVLLHFYCEAALYCYCFITSHCWYFMCTCINFTPVMLAGILLINLQWNANGDVQLFSILFIFPVYRDMWKTFFTRKMLVVWSVVKLRMEKFLWYVDVSVSCTDCVSVWFLYCIVIYVPEVKGYFQYFQYWNSKISLCLSALCMVHNNLSFHGKTFICCTWIRQRIYHILFRMSSCHVWIHHDENLTLLFKFIQ
jgi:hypothetical protein